MKDFTDKVTGKNWIYLERNTLYREWAISEGKRPWEKHIPWRVGHLRQERENPEIRHS